MQVKVELADQTMILATLDDTPPLTVMGQGTDDQRARLWLLKERNLFLRDKLTAYFSGQAELNIEGLNQFDQDSLELKKDELLAFYALIQGSWGDIIEVAESEGVYLSDSGIHQPGDYISKLIEAQTMEIVASQIFQYFRFAPDTSRKQVKLLKDAQKLLGEQPYDEMNRPDKRKVDLAIAEKTKLFRTFGSEAHRSFILGCCRKLAKKSGKHSGVRRRLETYSALTVKAFKLTSSQLHPRKGRKGWEMVNGQKQTMGRYGGVASVYKTSQ